MKCPRDLLLYEQVVMGQTFDLGGVANCSRCGFSIVEIVAKPVLDFKWRSIYDRCHVEEQPCVGLVAKGEVCFKLYNKLRGQVRPTI